MNKKIVLTIAAVAIVGIAAFALLQSKNKVHTVADAPSSAASAAPEDALYENSNFKKYWAENEDVKAKAAADLLVAREGATVVEGESCSNTYQVYEDKDGKFIISYATKVYLSPNGRWPDEAQKTLRREGTGEKLSFSFLPFTRASADDYLKMFLEKSKGNILSFDERTKIGHSFGEVVPATKYGVELHINCALVVDSMGFVSTLSFADGENLLTHGGYIPLNQICAIGIRYGFIKDYFIDGKKCTFTVMTAGGDINMEYQIGSSTDPFEVTKALANGKEIACPQDLAALNRPERDVYTPISSVEDFSKIPGPVKDVYVTLQHVGNAFGWDFDLYYGKTTCLNIVTDTNDILAEGELVYVNELEMMTPQYTELTMPGEMYWTPESIYRNNYEPQLDFVIIESGPHAGEYLDVPPEEITNNWTEEDMDEFIAKKAPEAARRSKMTREEKIKEDTDYENLPPEEKVIIDEVIAAYNS